MYIYTRIIGPVALATDQYLEAVQYQICDYIAEVFTFHDVAVAGVD